METCKNFQTLKMDILKRNAFRIKEHFLSVCRHNRFNIVTLIISAANNNLKQKALWNVETLLKNFCKVFFNGINWKSFQRFFQGFMEFLQEFILKYRITPPEYVTWITLEIYSQSYYNENFSIIIINNFSMGCSGDYFKSGSKYSVKYFSKNFVKNFSIRNLSKSLFVYFSNHSYYYENDSIQGFLQKFIQRIYVISYRNSPK